MKTKTVVVGSLLAFVVSSPGMVVAQEAAGEILEEIVVTGSFIKRESFNAGSPIEVIDAEEIRAQGAGNMGQVVRDLSFSQNVDTVANVLGTQDGAQGSTNASFNLRGLGTSSTLTLFDGRRVVQAADGSVTVQSLVPDIALEQVQILLDGGAATYGSDAVAGVVNFIPVKKYDGLKVSFFYNQDDGGDFNEPKLGVLWGKSYDSVDVVAALDYHKRTPLRRYERPKYLAYDDDDSLLGNPGRFGAGRDPRCGEGNPTDLTTVDDAERGAFPAGYQQSFFCRFEFGEFQDYNRELEETLAYVNVTYALNDNVELGFQTNLSWREGTTATSPSTADTTSNSMLTVPAYHPDNTFGGGAGVTTSPTVWRPFGKYGTLPSSGYEDGAQQTKLPNETQRFRVSASYDFGDTTWSGETAIGSQVSTTRTETTTFRQSRLDAALRGFGGPDCTLTASGDLVADALVAGTAGCEYFNPFYYDSVTGTVNSQELVDWIAVKEDYESSESELTYIDTVVTGEVFDLPAGPVAVAVGAQLRNASRKTTPSPINLEGDDYNSPAQSFIVDNESEVFAQFAEIDVPITDQLNLVGAIRREEFKDFDLSTTVPKISVSYEPIDTLSLRASFGEGFVAPNLGERGPRQFDSQCVEIFTATPDPFLVDNLSGASSCFSANPDVGPEESELKSVGLSWRPIEDLEISLDWQSVEYTDRIVTPQSQELLTLDFAAFEAAAAAGLITRVTDPDDSPSDDPAGYATDLQTWLDSGLASPLIDRSLPNNEVDSVTRLPQNASSNKVGVFDIGVQYSMDTNLGYFVSTLRASGYQKYLYKATEDFKYVDGVGMQNGDTAQAPPMPRWKGNIRLSWLNGNHSASIGADYIGHVQVDTSRIDDNTTLKEIFVPSRLSSHTTIDVRYSYMFENLLGGEVQMSIGSNNVTDSNPDPLFTDGGLETRLHDPFGRTVYLDILYEPSF